MDPGNRIAVNNVSDTNEARVTPHADVTGSLTNYRGPPAFKEIQDYSVRNGIKYYLTLCEDTDGSRKKCVKTIISTLSIFVSSKQVISCFCFFRYYFTEDQIDPQRGLPMVRSFENGIKCGELHRRTYTIINQNVSLREYKEVSILVFGH